MTRSPSPHASRADLLVVRTRDPNGLKNIDDPNDATTLVGFLSKPTIAAILVFSFEGGVCTSALWIPFKARRGAVVAPRTIARRKPHTSQHLAVSLAGHRRREFELSPSFIPNIPPSDPCSLARRLPSSGVEVQDTLLNGTEQSTRSTFTANLVGHALKSLKTIWAVEITPPATVSQTSTPITPVQSIASRPSMKTPLFLQDTPLSHPSPSHSISSTSLAYFCNDSGEYGNGTADAERTLVPLQKFVCDILRRSRTTHSVLQTALCYVEAVRPKVPVIFESERSGKASKEASSIEDRIELGYLPGTPTSTTNLPNRACAVNKSHQAPPRTTLGAEGRQDGLKKQSVPLKPLPPLPSPLLCPRRSFLAALILASKFLQDRCHTNRYWAKLTGLSPREVSRCERSLGEALDWRLWVGKPPVVHL